MNTKFIFYSKSADKPPGKGIHEHLNSKDTYIELSKIKDWRKQLSNIYIYISPIEIDGEIYNSVEHFFSCCKIYERLSRIDS